MQESKQKARLTLPSTEGSSAWWPEWGRVFAGEHTVRFIGVAMAAGVAGIVIFSSYFLLFSNSVALERYRAVTSPVKQEVASIKRGSLSKYQHVLIVSASASTEHSSVRQQLNTLKVAVASHFDVAVSPIDIEDYRSSFIGEVDVVLILGNEKIDNRTKLLNLIEDILSNEIPVVWIGKRFSEIADYFNVKYSAQRESFIAPPGSNILYQDGVISADGLVFDSGKLAFDEPEQEIIAVFHMKNVELSPAIIRKDRLLYVSFVPFLENRTSVALAVFLDAMDKTLVTLEARGR